VGSLVSAQTVQQGPRTVQRSVSLPAQQPSTEPTARAELGQQQPRRQQRRRVPVEEPWTEQELPQRRQLIQAIEQEVRNCPFELIESDDFPLGGRLRYFADFWRQIAPRKDIMNVILGVTIPFTSEPRQSRFPQVCAFNHNELAQVRDMVEDLLKMEVIEPVSPSSDQFVSQLFLVTNKDLSRRAILNVKQINQKFLPKQHFKMETLQLILPLIRKGDWFGSWDLRKGYFNIAVHPDFQRFFCFDFKGVRYQFKCLVMGLSLAPWFFTKVMSVSVQLACSWGILVSVYLDDSLTRARSFERALADHQAFGNLLQRAGFLLHRVKSVQQPVQRIEHLGFVIDSTTMMLEVPVSKEDRIRTAVKSLIRDILKRKKSVDSNSGQSHWTFGVHFSGGTIWKTSLQRAGERKVESVSRIRELR
jgi:hypothetical protein